MRLGINVNVPSYGQCDLKFGDLMTGCSGWSGVPGTANGAWPLSGPLPPTGQTLPAATGYLRPGAYTITCGGIGMISFSNPEVTPQFMKFTGANESYPVTLTKQDGLLCSIVKNDATNPLNGLHIYAPGAMPGQLWHPDYLASLEPFAVLRSVDWLGTSSSKMSTWEQRHIRPGYEVEGFLDLCNQVDADPWLCLPHLCSSTAGVTDYPSGLGTLIGQMVPSHRTVYLEYSNECWNWAPAWAAETGYCMTQGPQICDPATGKSLGLGMVGGYGWLANQAFNAVAAAVPPGGPRLVRVFAGQAASYGGTMAGVLSNGAKLGWQIGALACAPYMGWTDAAPYTQAAIAELLAAGDTAAAISFYCQGVMAQNLTAVQGWLSQWSAAAKSIGVPLLCYEASIGIPNLLGSLKAPAPAAPTLQAAQADPKLAALTLAYYNALAPYCDFANQYSHACLGVWGAKQHADDTANQQWQGLLTFAAENNT